MTLQDKLADVEARLEKHYRTSLTGAQSNPAGDIGGIRGRSQKRKDQIFNRYSREAAQGVALQAERDRILTQIKIEQEAPARERHNLRLLAAWDALKAGDTFRPGNNVITIRNKNTWSVTDTNGISWAIHEVVGLSRKEAEALTQSTQLE